MSTCFSFDSLSFATWVATACEHRVVGFTHGLDAGVHRLLFVLLRSRLRLLSSRQLSVTVLSPRKLVRHDNQHSRLSHTGECSALLACRATLSDRTSAEPCGLFMLQAVRLASHLYPALELHHHRGHTPTATPHQQDWHGDTCDGHIGRLPSDGIPERQVAHGRKDSH